VQSEIHAYALGNSATSASPRARLAMLSKRCDCAICPPCGGPADRSADCSIPRYTEVEAVPTPLSVLPKVNYSDSALAHLTSGPQNLREPLCYFPHLRVLRLNAPPKVNPTTFVLQLQPVVGPSGPKRPTNLLDCSASSKGPRIRLCDPIGDPLVPVILRVEFSERPETATAMIVRFARGLGGTLSLELSRLGIIVPASRASAMRLKPVGCELSHSERSQEPRRSGGA
jgi:hypothetical protein